MAVASPFTPASSGATPFPSTPAPALDADTVALVRSVHELANDPFQALSVLHQLLRSMDLDGTVPVHGLVLLLEPMLSQLELLRDDARTLRHALLHEVVQ